MSNANAIQCPRCQSQFQSPAQPGEYQCPTCQTPIIIAHPAAAPAPRAVPLRRKKRGVPGWVWIVGVWLFAFCVPAGLYTVGMSNYYRGLEKASPSTYVIPGKPGQSYTLKSKRDVLIEYLAAYVAMFKVTIVPAFIVLMVWWLRQPRATTQAN